MDLNRGDRVERKYFRTYFFIPVCTLLLLRFKGEWAQFIIISTCVFVALHIRDYVNKNKEKK